jgi:NADPH:quinone reductase-like Zn-dependent oxidoreductase
MKGLQIKKFGDVNSDEVMEMAQELPKPTLKPDSSDILVKVLTCALNPVDCRIISGDMSMIMKPHEFPYTPGLDICGIVEDHGSKCTRFKKGDRIVAGFVPFRYAPFAEYVVCDDKFAVLCPLSLNPTEGAALPASSVTALKCMREANIKEGSKVLILGASGGVGTLLVQMAKSVGASLIVGTSTNQEFVKSLGAHQVIDYRSEKWWEVLKDQNLDAVIDCVGGKESWVNCKLVLSSKGKFYTLVGDSVDGKMQSLSEIVTTMLPLVGRVMKITGVTYGFVTAMANGPDLQEVVDQVNAGKLKPILDPSSPYPFTLDGMRRAMNLQSSHRAKGKLIFTVCEV